MLGIFAKLMLTVSALAPVAFVYFCVALSQGKAEVAFWSALIGIAAFLFCLIILWVAKHKVAESAFQAKTIEAADGENIGFLLLYLMPIFTSSIETLKWELWVPTGALFFLLILNGYAHHFNPLLGIAGWHFYKVTGKSGITFILISRKRLANAALPLKVGQLTDNVLFDLGGKHDHNSTRTVQTG